MTTKFLSAWALLFLFSILPSGAESSTTSIFIFDASEMQDGEVDREALKEASASGIFGSSLAEGQFTLKFQNSTIPAQIVGTAKSRKALQITLPGQTDAPLVTFEYVGTDLASHIDEKKPLFLELEIQQGDVPSLFAAYLNFRPEARGWLSIALASVRTPDGPCLIFKSGPLSTADSLSGPSLPAGEPTVLRFEVLPGEEKAINNTILSSGSVLFDEQTIPAWLARTNLTELSGVSITVQSFPGEESTESSFKILKVRAWQ